MILDRLPVNQAPWLRDELVAAQIRAGRSWRADADLPDSLDFADITSCPALTAEVIRNRRRQSAGVGSPSAMAYPKPNGRDLRRETVLDPFADLAYLALLTPAVPHIERHLSRRNVFSVRAEIFATGAWRTVPWRQAQARLHEVLAEFDDDSSFAVGQMDVQNHFATVDTGPLARTLSSVGCADSTVRGIVAFLDELGSVVGVPHGLPIGPEASAVLGTVALVSLDRLLERVTLRFTRWVDDITFLVGHERLYGLVHDEVAAHLESRRQRANHAKCQSTRADQWQPHRAGHGSGLSWDDDVAADEAVASLIEAVEAEDFAVIAAPLGRLRSLSDPRAVSILQRHPKAVMARPKQCASYLRKVQAEIADWQWAIDLALGETTDWTAAGQLHLLRAVPRSAVGSSDGQRLFEKAATLDRDSFAALADHMAVKAGQSPERTKTRRVRAVDLAETTDDVNAQRSLMAVLKDGTVDRVSRRAVNHLVRRSPDLAPTASWIAA